MINTKHPQWKTRSKMQKANIRYCQSRVVESLSIMDENPVESPKFFQALCTWKETNYVLQSLWGFKQHGEYHKFWELPKCICPKIDNEDRYPSESGDYWHTENCPVCELLKQV